MLLSALALQAMAGLSWYPSEKALEHHLRPGFCHCQLLMYGHRVALYCCLRDLLCPELTESIDQFLEDDECLLCVAMCQCKLRLVLRSYNDIHLLRSKPSDCVAVVLLKPIEQNGLHSRTPINRASPNQLAQCAAEIRQHVQLR